MLQWLSDRFSRLWYLLDYAWTSISDWASRSWSSVLNYINSAIDSARNYLSSLYNNVISSLNSWVDWLKSRISDVSNWASAQFNSFKSWVNQLWNDVKSWASAKFSDISQWVSQKWSDLKTWATAAWNDVQQFATNIGATVKAWAVEAFENVKAWFNEIVASVSQTFNELVGKAQASVDNLSQSIIGPVISFFDNPALFIWGIIETYLYPFMEWWLSKMFGGVKFEPPAKPDFFGAAYIQGTTGGIYAGAVSGSFVYPTPTTYVSGYRFSSSHPGIDLGINTGDPIRAVAAGTIMQVGYDPTGYGVYVKMSHGDGWTSLYGHLQSAAVTVGQSVEQGRIIALGDSTGHSTGPHLHLEIRKDGAAIDPLSVLG